MIRTIQFAFLMFASFAILLCTGCKHGGSGNTASQGWIEYDVTAVDPSNPMADLAPNKMLVKFKEKRSVAEMSAGMGLLTMTFVSDYNTKTVTQLVKLLNKKYASTANAEELQKEKNNSGITVTKTNDTKLIAGFKCKKAKVTCANHSHPDFDVYYTDEIELENPNWGNEYSDIDGVLMEYQLKRYNIELLFTARKVEKKHVEDSEFDRPADYKLITQKELDDLFVGMQ